MQRPDVVDLWERNRQIAELFYEKGWTRAALAQRFGITSTAISGVLRQVAAGGKPAHRYRGTTSIKRTADSPISGCPVCGSHESSVAGSTYDEAGTMIRLRICDLCGKPRPTAEVNVYDVTFSALNHREAETRGAVARRRFEMSRVSLPAEHK